MKKILITGSTSYCGLQLTRWLSNSFSDYIIRSISLRDDSWRQVSFSEFDVVYHVAGIAHVNETAKNRHLYYEINRDLAYEVACKAKAEGIKQFIFLSSMSVYGIEQGAISASTEPMPRSSYGKSKLQAEQLIQSITSSEFRVAIVRPPMIYGHGAKGNYARLSNIARKFPIFPAITNQRSMLFIDNLCEFIRILIDQEKSGIFLPQNREYVNTSELVFLIASMNKKQMIPIKAFNFLINFLKVRISILSKVFGDLYYDQDISNFEMNYHVANFIQSIELTEKVDLCEN